MAESKEQVHIQKARFYDAAERYQDMAVEMRNVLQICHEENLEITMSIRNLFSLAYKNLVSSRRNSWRVLFSEKQKLEEKQSSELQIVEEILGRVEEELLAYSQEVLDIIDSYALTDIDSKPLPNKVFFLKMKGDYYRYKAEVLSGEEEKDASNLALQCYTAAKDLAEGLSCTDPIRLGLYLNFSVFNYEILSNTEAACNIARKAFSDAIAGLDALSEDYYKDSTLIMQLLRDNLTLWSSKNDASQSKANDDNVEHA
ncbi:14-3-3 protein beta/theta/zeta [Pancytospora philotis]|nr:14-3-3 protein beta/theta/zeta [Pancytospora philotis]